MISWSSNVVKYQFFKKGVLYILSSLLFFQVYSQQDTFQFSHYSTLEGLSENYVNCIFQDSKGFIWIGTNDGLNRFDGYQFKIYRYNRKDKSGIGSNLIQVIAEDNDGNLWIGTANEGIFKLNVKTDQFIQLKNTASKPDVLTKNSGRDILKDKYGNIWIANLMGLNVLTPSANTGDSLTKPRKIFFDGGPIDIRIITSDENNIWIGSRFGLFVLKGIDRKMVDATHLQSIPFGKTKFENELVEGIVPIEDGLLVAFGFGIYKYEFQDEKRIEGSFHKVSNLFCRELYLDNRGILWCGTNDGLSRLELNEDKSKVISEFHYTSKDAENSLSNDVITCFFQDNAGLLWIGTHGGGVNVLNTNKKKFRHYRHTSNKGAISTNIIRSIFEDSEGNLFIGTNEGILNVLPNAANKHYSSGFVQYDLNNLEGDRNEVYSFTETKEFNGDRRLWIGVGFPKTLISMDLSSDNWGKKLFTPYPHIKNPIHAFLPDRNNHLWIATYRDGLYQLSNRDRKVIINHFLADRPNGIASNIVRSLLFDRKGNLWIGTGNGLSKLPYVERFKEEPKIITYKHNASDSASLSHDYILPIFESSDGQVWVGTMGGGLNRLVPGNDVDDDTFEVISTDDGLPNDVIKSILEDDLGNLWVSSNKGISKVNPNSLEIKNYDIFDGLQDFEFMEMAAFKRKDGEMLFGGVNGFNAFYPNQIVDDTSKANIVLTDFQLSHRSIEAGEELDGNVVLNKIITETSDISLNHRQNSFAITFASLHFAAPKKNKYAYKLQGFDDKWIKVDAEHRTAKYTNLGAGTYKFMVKSTNNDGLWTDDIRELNIIIAKPPYFSRLALFLYAAMFVLMIWFLRRYSIIRNKKKNELLVARLEKEKLDELTKLKFTFFTNISHEFKTPLSLIIGHHDSLEKNWNAMSKDKIKSNFKIINRNAKVLLRLINQLMDFRKLEQGKMKLSCQEDNIVEFVEQIHDSFQALMHKKGIRSQFKSNRNQILIYFDHDKMEKVIYNLFSNAIKYTSHHGKIETLIVERSSYITIKISDNGIGIPTDMQAHLFERFYQGSNLRRHLAGNYSGTGIGLSLSKELVEIQGGVIAFESQENVGTSFKLSFPKGTKHLSEEQIVDESPQAMINVEERGISYDDLVEKKQIMRDANVTTHQKSGFKVLVVDDNEAIRQLIKAGLSADFLVVEAANGVEAFDLCNSEYPDLVVSDIFMPAMDGYELCQTIKTDPRTSHIPIILLTAKDSSEGRIKSYNEGADGYVSKPFNINELNAHIQSVIASRNKVRSRFKEIASINPHELDISSLDKKFISNVTSYVEKNLEDQSLSVELLASNFQISDVTLNKKLKSITGKTANSFIRSIRLKRALYLLQNEALTISEITYKVGFNDLKYFRSCFKKEFQLNPSDFRRQVTD